jgi:uncharacterized delta-60 repeat protein
MSPFRKIISLVSLLILSVFPAATHGRASAPVEVMASNASNSLDASFVPVFTTPGDVRGIVPLAGGKVFIYGRLTSVNGFYRNKVAVLNADGTLDSSFNLDPALKIYGYSINAAVAMTDGKFLVGGSLEWYGPTHLQSYLLRLNADGSIDPTFDASGWYPPPSPIGSYGIDNQVTALHVDGSGRILVGGDFTSPYNHITRLLADGAPDPDFDPGTGTDGSVTLIGTQPNGGIILGGTFTHVDDNASNGVARLQDTGTFDGTFFGNGVVNGSNDCGDSGNVLTLATQSDNSVLVGGSFISIKSQVAPLLTRIKADGSLDTGFVPYIREGYMSEVTSLAVAGDKVAVGGWHSDCSGGGLDYNHRAEIFVLSSTTGSSVGYIPFRRSPTNEETDVWAMEVRSDGKVLAGGNFTRMDDVDQLDFAGLFLFTASPYTQDLTFRPLVGNQATVKSLAVQSDGQILAAGSFHNVNGEIHDDLVRLNSNNSVDSIFSPGSYGSDFLAVNVRADGKIIAAEGYAGNGAVLLLNPDGTYNAVGNPGFANGLISRPDLQVIAATAHAPGVAQLTPDMTEETAFSANRGTGISNGFNPDEEFDRVNAVALQGNKIIAGGSFSTFSGVAHQNLVRLDAGGAVDTTFTPPAFTEKYTFFRHEIFALAVQPNGRILVGGRFTTAGGVATPTLARLNANGTLDTTFQSSLADGLVLYALALQPDGKILAGGDFGLVRLNADGSNDASFSAGVNGFVSALAFVSPNQVLLGGGFSKVDGQPRFGLARYNVTVEEPSLVSNYTTGAPGSFFTLTISHFPPNTNLLLTANGHSLGEGQTDAAGQAVFILDAALASPGNYAIQAEVKPYGTRLTLANTTASTLIQIEADAPVRAKVGTGTVFAIPTGIAMHQIFLPLIMR